MNDGSMRHANSAGPDTRKDHPETVFTCAVKQEWVDYNGHMNDAAYVQVFSLAVDCVLLDLGLDKSTRDRYRFSIYTLENHVRYVRECHEGDAVDVSAQIIDSDKKRLHIFLTMHDSNGEVLATSEQMLMGVATDEGKSAPFPYAIAAKVAQRAEHDAVLARPKGVGSSIGIRRKS